MQKQTLHMDISIWTSKHVCSMSTHRIILVKIRDFWCQVRFGYKGGLAHFQKMRQHQKSWRFDWLVNWMCDLIRAVMKMYRKSLQINRRTTSGACSSLWSSSATRLHLWVRWPDGWLIFSLTDHRAASNTFTWTFLLVTEVAECQLAAYPTEHTANLANNDFMTKCR